MYDDAIDPYDVGMRELSRRLEAFADTRLNPSLSGTSRMRTTVMNAAHRRAALIAADRTFDAVAAAAAAVPGVSPLNGPASRSRAWRRPMAALAAGALMLALVGGTASAANAGGPLYAARIWIEMANLPAGALARADAEITRLDARLQEARQAYARGDGPAAEAALTAYSVILTEAVAGSAADPAASAAIESSLTRHVVDLELMVASVPPTGQGAVRHALASSTVVLNDLDDAIVQDGHDSQGRPADDVLAPTGPTGTKPAPPTKGPGAAAGAAPRCHRPSPRRPRLPTRAATATATAGLLPVMPIPRAQATPIRPPIRRTSRPVPNPGGPDRPDAPRRDRCGARVHRSTRCHRRFVPAPRR